MPVTKLAKWKTTVQLVAIGFLLAGEAGDLVFPFVTQVGLLLLWISAIFTIYTAGTISKPVFTTSSTEDEK